MWIRVLCDMMDYSSWIHGNLLIIDIPFHKFPVPHFLITHPHLSNHSNQNKLNKYRSSGPFLLSPNSTPHLHLKMCFCCTSQNAAKSPLTLNPKHPLGRRLLHPSQDSIVQRGHRKESPDETGGSTAVRRKKGQGVLTWTLTCGICCIGVVGVVTGRMISGDVL